MVERCKLYIYRKINIGLQFLFYLYSKALIMNCQLSEIESHHVSPNKGKVLGVIVLTDSRNQKRQTKHLTCDYRNSSFKESEADLNDYHHNEATFCQEEDRMAELSRRVVDLEQRVKALYNSGQFPTLLIEESQQDVNKRKRRTFKELKRDYTCVKCHKIYGSQTSLKFHLKLKHPSNDENCAQAS